MQLKEYLQQKKISYAKFADLLGMHTQSVYSWICNKRYPTIETQMIIHDYTKGKVTYSDWIELRKNKKDFNKRE